MQQVRLVSELELKPEQLVLDLFAADGNALEVATTLCLLNLDLLATGHTFPQLATDFDQNLGCRWTTRHLVIPLE